MRITICTITRRRPEGLARLLKSLEKIEIDPGVTLRVVIVENDTPRPDAIPECSIPIHHVFEPRLGIPIARNRSIEEAISDADRLIFLDDDETVDPTWLSRLLAAEKAFGSPVITGPALPRFPDGSPAWAEHSGIYVAPRYETGTKRPWAFTHNSMIRTDVIKKGEFRFDETMGFTGGSDKEFFRRVTEAGHDIIWADDAIAWEWYPLDRIRWRWVFQRSYRLGTNAVQAEHVVGILGRVGLLGRSARFFVRAMYRTIRHVTSPGTAIACASWDIGRAAGLISGVLGSRYEEYADRRDS